MRILFSVYAQLYDDHCRYICQKFRFEKYIETEMDYSSILQFLQPLKVPYDYSYLEGDNLCFWDFYYPDYFVNELISKINEIPALKSNEKRVTRKKEVKYSKILINPSNKLNANSTFSDNSFIYYQIDEQRRGAGGIETFIALIQQNPILLSIIASLVADSIIEFFKWIVNKIKKTRELSQDDSIAIINIENFYYNFANTIRVTKDDLQIIEIKKKYCKISINVRTVSNDFYNVISTRSGIVKSFTYIGNERNKPMTGY